MASDKRKQRKEPKPRHHKWCTIHFKKEHVAQICNISKSTLRRRCDIERKELENMTLTEFILFILKYSKNPVFLSPSNNVK